MGKCLLYKYCFIKNYKSFDKIVQRDKKDKIIGLQERVQENIINKTSEYFLSNVKKIEDKDKYEETYTDQSITIKTNFNSNQAFQNINSMYKAQQIHSTELRSRLIILCIQEEKLKRQKSTDTFEYNKNIYYRKVEKFKKCIEKLENIPKFIVTRKTIDFMSIPGYHTIRLTNEIVDYDTNILLEHLKTATNELFNNIQNSNDKTFKMIIR